MNFFPPPRGTKLCFLIRQNKNLVTCQMSPVIIFRLSTLKGTAKAPAEDLLMLNTLRGTKTTFLTPKRYDKHTHSFYMGAPPPPLLILFHSSNICNFTDPKKSILIRLTRLRSKIKDHLTGYHVCILSMEKRENTPQQKWSP